MTKCWYVLLCGVSYNYNITCTGAPVSPKAKAVVQWKYNMQLKKKAYGATSKKGSMFVGAPLWKPHKSHFLIMMIGNRYYTYFYRA